MCSASRPPLCTAIRRACADDGALADALFGRRRLPTLVQYDPVDRFFEQDGERLVFTGEGGTIPLVRYAIGDTGGVIAYDDMMTRLRAHGFAMPACTTRAMPFVFVFGRSQHAVSFYGANVFVETVRLGLEDPTVCAAVTGKLVMEVHEDAAGDARLKVDVELARGADVADSDLAQAIVDAMRGALIETGGEFAAYVPAERQTPEVTLHRHGDPTHFPIGVKHSYVRR